VCWFPGPSGRPPSGWRRGRRRRNRSAIDAAHIQQFQSSLGSARFAVIDAAVQAASTVKTVKVKPPAATAKAGGKP
jgi:adenylate kinase